MLFPTALIFGCWALVIEGADNRRPIWNMGHMVNEVYQIDEFVDLGANSIETDITFDDDAMAEYSYHGVPCDCRRWCHKWEYVNVFLDGLRRATTPGDSKYRPELTLVVFDLKTGDLSSSTAYKGGKLFAQKLLDRYWNGGNNGGRAYIIISIPDIDHYAFITGFREALKNANHEELLDKVGYDFSGNDDLSSTRTALNKAGVKDREHVWQSDGITNCILRGLDRVREAVRNRDSSNGYINKVYYWTIEKYVSVRDALDAGVDGIMTNEPDVIVNVLNEGNYRGRFRLANYDDNPWVTFK
uniref:Dermonecrotic toxin LiSicTox-alphaIVA1 n=1 Tax=Loxosceles intermedia TaxID=58218 RepID=A4A1_LOXIN|nr:RecName: Full=Dermonecrotic toxin LiSicTox-alphaIVA1; AltName: Full=Dermonecrotic toxin 7; Short=DT7; AltName: Full=LiRecDT7; AltName: Full=Phospholipase D; Short=PLD; AltName: Full=Sphingomyelin phosphodiesterase D 7; Short=SMD 7; Short=SMase D 7; Short=Sphingomyelinase D 7; Flags: Precursor [Loxosceles intermedia]AGN52903.1 dermonecrotic toxin isoform 7 [Loxosceles intermedia]